MTETVKKPPLSLNDLGRFYGTDKQSGWGHDYLRWYEPILKPLREASGVVFEIGVGNGASLKTWRAFFMNARIVGMDVDPVRARAATDRIEVMIGDQSSIDDLDRCLAGFGDDPLIIVNDDGSHVPDHQIATFKYLLPHLAPGGVYLVEDVIEARAGEFFWRLGARCLFANWTEQAEDDWIREHGSRIDSVAFYGNAVAIWVQPTERVMGKPIAWSKLA